MELTLENIPEYGSHHPDYEDSPISFRNFLRGEVPHKSDLMVYQQYMNDVIEGNTEEVSYRREFPLGIRKIIDLYHGPDFCEDIRERYLEWAPFDYLKEMENLVWDDEYNLMIMDDHNHALAAWAAADNSGLLEGETTLVHVDKHLDDSRAAIETGELNEIPEDMMSAEWEIGQRTHITDFVEPALEFGIADRKVNWGLPGYNSSIEDIENFIYESNLMDNNIIFDLDLDVFHNITGSEVPRAQRLFAEIINSAVVATASTSPGYTYQDDALGHLEGIYQYL